jgi:D-alanyl-D-alanine carboxypeptidase
MRKIFSITFLAITVLFINFNLSAQQKADYSTKIDSLLKKESPRSFNGVVYIQENGKMKYAKAYGFADFNKKTTLKINDNFSTMSIAKQITATLILQEVEKGTIDLHTPIRSYLPDFQYSWVDTVTVHNLLNHTGGLHADEIKPFLKLKIGTAFSYSNAGYSLLGQILENQSNKTFETLVTALFKKCKMKNSHYPNEASQRNLTKGHLIKKDGMMKQFEKISFTPDQYWGSHLIVTASDLATWNECLHNGKLLKPITYKLMTSYSITNSHSLFGKNPIGYGYGLRINDKQGIKEIGHTGFHPAQGFTAVNLYYPETKTSIIVMENQAAENSDIAYYFEQEIRRIVREFHRLK